MRKGTHQACNRLPWYVFKYQIIPKQHLLKTNFDRTRVRAEWEGGEEKPAFEQKLCGKLVSCWGGGLNSGKGKSMLTICIILTLTRSAVSSQSLHIMPTAASWS